MKTNLTKDNLVAALHYASEHMYMNGSDWQNLSMHLEDIGEALSIDGQEAEEHDEEGPEDLEELSECLFELAEVISEAAPKDTPKPAVKILPVTSVDALIEHFAK